MRLWIDTDIGTDVDDALAIGYALRHPDIELVGVSTVFGDVELRARMVEELLRRASAAPCPVLAGLGKPFTPERIGLMVGHEGKGLLKDANARIRTESDPDPEGTTTALGQAIEAARADALVAIGPLTNIGALIRAGVALPRLAIMGGQTREFTVQGRKPLIDEWNWFCDPVAVTELLEQPAPQVGLPLLVPAEITFRTEFIPGDIEALDEGDALAQALAELSRVWLVAQREELKQPVPKVHLHDPLTVAVLTTPELCPTEPMRLTISDEGKTTRCEGPPNVEAAIDVDVDGARLGIINTLLGKT
jgi:purine nucleosidase